MKRRVSLTVTFACAMLTLGVGIGVGYAIEHSNARALDSEVEEKSEQIVAQESQITVLNSEKIQLQFGLNDVQIELDSTQQELDSSAHELSLFKEHYNGLTDYYKICRDEYKALQTSHEALQAACNGTTVEEILELRGEISSLQSQNAWLTSEVSRLENQMTPSPSNALKESEVWGDPKFKSTAWEGKSFQLRSKLEELGKLYGDTHTYIQGETDCNDMAVDTWNMLLTEDIKSVIVVGNKDMEDETFGDCDHAWLYVFDADGMVIYLEPTTGEVFYGRLKDGSSNPDADPYRDGFIYENPSDLWRDLCPSTHNW